jgi:hypothetical protein
MTGFALYVELKAKPGREEDVAAIVQALKAGRNAHLNGAVAAALMANAAELLAVAPEIRQPSVLADKLPG